MKLGQSDLVSFFIVLAIPGDGKLGQADLVNSCAEGYLFGGPKQYSIQRESIPWPSWLVNASQYRWTWITWNWKQRVSNDSPHPGGHVVAT